MKLSFDLRSLSWRSFRGGAFASVGSLCLHRFEQGTVISNAGWKPGDRDVQTVEAECLQLPTMPRIFPPRFAWSTRPGRLGVREEHGFASFLDPFVSGDQGGAFIELHPPAGKCGGDVVDTWIDCSPIAAFHRGSGRPLTRRDVGTWLEYRLGRGRDSIQNLPMFVRGNEPADLQSWEAEDEYHLVRIFMRALGAWRDRRDFLAKWLINMCAADARIAYMLGLIPQTSEWMPFTLGRDLLAANANPEHGGHIVRGRAWVMRVLAADLEVGSLEEAETRSILGALVRYEQLVQTKGGAFYSAPYANAQGAPTYADNGEAWDLYGLGHEFSECPSWQVPFMVRALWEAQVVMPELHRRVIAILTKALKLWEDGERVPDMYGGAPGLHLYLSTAERGAPFAKITGGVGPARSMYDCDAFAVFVRAGLLPKLPAIYAAAGEPGITDDAVRVAAEFGVAA